jgi:hypothetical protein
MLTLWTSLLIRLFDRLQRFFIKVKKDCEAQVAAILRNRCNSSRPWGPLSLAVPQTAPGFAQAFCPPCEGLRPSATALAGGRRHRQRARHVQLGLAVPERPGRGPRLRPGAPVVQRPPMPATPMP